MTDENKRNLKINVSIYKLPLTKRRCFFPCRKDQKKVFYRVPIVAPKMSKNFLNRQFKRKKIRAYGKKNRRYS